MNWFKCDKCKNVKWEAQKKSRTCEDCNIPMTPCEKTGPTDKRWVLVDFGSCPNCGDDAEILTSSDKPALFYDGDEVRCCQGCGEIGHFSYDESEGYINWYDE